MGFIDDERVELRAVTDTTWELITPITYVGKVDTFVVPKGSHTDLASVPGVLTWLVPRYGRYTKSAILHDFLWRTGPVSRSDADGIFRRSMRELGVPILRRWAMWAAVRAASTFKRKPGETDSSLRTKAAIVGIGAAATPIVAVPAAAVSVALLEAWLLEHVAAAIARLYYKARPAKAKPVNTPHILDAVRQS